MTKQQEEWQILSVSEVADLNNQRLIDYYLAYYSADAANQICVRLDLDPTMFEGAMLQLVTALQNDAFYSLLSDDPDNVHPNVIPRMADAMKVQGRGSYVSALLKMRIMSLESCRVLIDLIDCYRETS